MNMQYILHFKPYDNLFLHAHLSPCLVCLLCVADVILLELSGIFIMLMWLTEHLSSLSDLRFPELLSGPGPCGPGFGYATDLEFSFPSKCSCRIFTHSYGFLYVNKALMLEVSVLGQEIKRQFFAALLHTCSSTL